jgi:hypothetical protein
MVSIIKRLDNILLPHNDNAFAFMFLRTFVINVMPFSANVPSRALLIYAHYLALKTTDKITSLRYATTSGQGANEVTAKVAKTRGVDLSKHVTTDLSDFVVNSGAYFLRLAVI